MQENLVIVFTLEYDKHHKTDFIDTYRIMIG